MPVFETRKLRDLAAALMLLAGITQVAHLWLYTLTGTTIVTAMFGVVYFLIALGLAGKSRFSLWVAVIIPALAVVTGMLRQTWSAPIDLNLLNVSINLLVLFLCGYTLYRTRHSEMD
jgi:hypothetical protein